MAHEASTEAPPPMRKWRVKSRDSLFRHPLLELERRQLAAGDDRREALVVKAPDWVNVIPVTEDDRVLLIRQWRYGIEAPTLEIPGGVVEVDEAHLAAARRELFEETGHRAGQWQPLGEVHANPAILTNRVSTWLARDLVRVGEPEGDGEEEIELTSAPMEEIPELIAAGHITHSLVVAAFYLLHSQRR